MNKTHEETYRGYKIVITNDENGSIFRITFGDLLIEHKYYLGPICALRVAKLWVDVFVEEDLLG
jgi:hypothetical protein